jgi:hypothetical protein
MPVPHTSDVALSRSELRRKLDENAGKLVRLIHSAPDDFDGREALWIDRFAMLRRFEEVC